MAVAHHTLVVLVENKAGVLARVASLFARRGYNIESLAVAPTDDPRFSRITIAVDAESAPIEQIVKQLFKLIHVIKISELAPGQAVERELALITIRVQAADRGQVIHLVQVFDGKIIDVGQDELMIMLAGESGHIDDFEELMVQYGIVELQRTGRVALAKLDRQARLRSVNPKAG